MSMQSLKFEIEGRAGRELLPTTFPIELVIGMTRKLALVADRSVPHEDLQVLTNVIIDYLGRVLGMQGAAQTCAFNARISESISHFTQELYDCLCEEIVSRLIEHDVRSLSLQDRLLGVLDAAVEPA